MSERTEEQKVFQEPLAIMLGGETYQVGILVIKRSREWRGQYSSLVAGLSTTAAISSDTPEAFESGVEKLMVEMPDAIVDLFFQYAFELDRDAIENVATDAEIAEGVKQIVAVAFPLVQALGGRTELQTVQPSRKERRQKNPQ